MTLWNKNEALILLNQAENIQNQLNQYEPVETIVRQVFSCLNQWKKKMYNFVNDYSEQIQMHIRHAQYRLNQQWNLIKQEYLQMLNDFAIEPIHQLLRGKSYFSKRNLTNKV